MTAEKLIDMAREAMTHAYAPYSHFWVGAAVLCGDGTVYQGCNVENTAYGECICAERTAMLKAVSDGQRKFEAIAICGGREGAIEGFCAPCGACRQVLSEFASNGLKIYLINGAGEIRTLTLGELLPWSFSSDNL